MPYQVDEMYCVEIVIIIIIFFCLCHIYVYIVFSNMQNNDWGIV
jgi:hypothetical protein